MRASFAFDHFVTAGILGGMRSQRSAGAGTCAIGTPLIAPKLDISGKCIHIAIITVNRFAVLVTNWTDFAFWGFHFKDATFSYS